MIIILSFGSVKADRLFSWGNNNHGQLGDGTTNERHTPGSIGNDTNWYQISCSEDHYSLAIKSDGTLWAWGYNNYGQLGDGTTTERHSPVQIGKESNWSLVKCGELHTLALKTDGTLWAWGNNNTGQLGDGSTNNKSFPVQIGTDKDWLTVACGWKFTLALKIDGTLWGWGYNGLGQLGDGTTNNKISPVQIGNDKDWVYLDCGEFHTIAIKSDGTLWAWGANNFGQLGDGTTTDKHTPIQIGSNQYCYKSTMENSQNVNTEAIRTDGSLWGWGWNFNGELGDGTKIQRNSPVQIGTSHNWLQVASAEIHTLAIKSDGTLWAWGTNGHGQLGNGTTSYSHSPIQIGYSTNWTQVAGGESFSLALNNSICKILTSTPSTINFGDRTCLSDTTINIVINNLMKETVGVSQTLFALKTISKLSVSNGGTFSIEGNDSRQLSIRINPTAAGLIKDTLIIIYPDGCDTLLKIPITGFRDTIDFTLLPSDTLNFGSTCPNAILDTLVKINNLSSRATSFIKNSNISPFSITGTDPFTSLFALNETKDLHLRFMSPDTGIFLRNLIITDTCGTYKKIVLKAEINVPKVDAGTDQTICSKDTLIIGNCGTGGTPPYKYHWAPLSGLSNSNTAAIKASPNVTTMYFVTITDNVGCSSTDSIKITVNPLPKPTIKGTFFVCENQSNIYTVSTPAGTSSAWYISGTINVDSIRKDTLIITWGNNRIGRITLIQTISATGCTDSVVEEITINSIPKPDITGNLSSCSNTLQTYYTTQKGFINQWYISGGNILGSSIGDTINVKWTDTSIAKLKLVQSNTVGCIDSVDLNIKVIPSPIVKLDENISICTNSSYTLKPVISSGKMPWVNLNWSPNTCLTNPYIINPTVNNLAPGNYKYILSITDINGCTGTDSINVNVKPLPEIALSKVFLDFGRIDPCQSSKEDTLEIINIGTENFIVDKSSYNSGFSLVSPLLPFILKPNEKQIIVVRYTAVIIGQVSSNLTFCGSPCNWTKVLLCKAEKTEMLLSSNISEVDFRQELVCTNISKDTTFILTNTSSDDITLDFENIILQTPFSLIYPKTNQKIPANGTINILVHYSPKTEGNYSEDIKIPFTAGICKDTLKLALSGSLVKPKLISEQRNVIFPDISGCENSHDTTITIKNIGTFDIILIDVKPSSIFSTSSKNKKIQAGEKQEITIKFSPNTLGTYFGYMIICFEPCGITDTIVVTGNKQGIVFNLADSLDFGEIIVCNDISKTLQFKIENLSSKGITGTVKSLIQITNPFNTNLKSGDSLRTGVSNLFDISVNINSTLPDGEITGSLDFILSPCDSMKSVKLRVKKTSINISSPSIIEFGQVNFGSSKSDTIRIKNTGTAVAAIESIDNILLPFELINTSPKLSAVLKPNEEINAIIRYTPNDELSDTISAAIKTEPCSIIKNLKLVGNTTSSSTLAVLQCGNIEGYPGDLLEVPLIITNHKKQLSTGVIGIKAELIYNSTLLMPFDYPIYEIDDTRSKIILDNLTIKNLKSDTLTKVRFKAGLGNSDVCDLTLSNVETIGGVSDISIQNGKFKLLGVCQEGGKRLINPIGKIQINSIMPNPANENIEIKFELLEISGYKLLLVNSNGQNVREIIRTSNLKGINEEKIGISDLSSGEYNLILQTDSERLSKRFLIVK
jgi:alpha-tubulin suppressor-like RCC1 family protein